MTEATATIHVSSMRPVIMLILGARRPPEWAP